MESQTRTIGTNTYTVTQFSATPAYVLLTKLMKILGPAFGALAAADKDKPGEAVSIAIGELTQRLDEAQMKQLVTQLVSVVLVDVANTPQPLSKIFESHFRGGNLSELFALLGFVLEVNFADFFGGLGRVKERAEAFAAQASKSPSTFGGTPGAS